MKPSAKAEALGAPVEVDIEKLEPGQRIVVLWRGKPVWVLKRTPEALQTIPELDAEVRQKVPNAQHFMDVA